MKFQYTEILTPVLLMKILLEPIIKRREIWVSSVCVLISLKTEIARSVKGPKITRTPCSRRIGGAVCHTEHQGSQWQLRISKQSPIRNCVQETNLVTWWIQALSVAKTKLHKKNQRSLQKFLEPERNQKSFTLTMYLEFGKLVKISPGINARSTPSRSETNGIAERAVRRVKEGTSAVLLQSGLNESWWADSMECYTYLRNVQIYFLMGRRPMKDVLGNHLKDLLFHLFIG